MQYFLLFFWLLLSVSLQASGPVMVMHQVVPGENWALLAQRYQLGERQLRLEFNGDRFMQPLSAGEWVWVPDRAALAIPARNHDPAVPVRSAEPSPSLPATLPQLGPPDPAAAPKTELVLLAVAEAARAAATDQLDSFVERQTASLTDETLQFGTEQLTALPWLNPDYWDWDYQLPLFDKDPRLNSRMALPVSSRLSSELGLDFRDDRLTYQFGLHYRQIVGEALSAHLEPVFDYQEQAAHRRGGLLLFLSHPDWTLGAGQYQGISAWRPGRSGAERPASGQLWFGEGQLGWVPGLSLSGQQYRWQGKQLSLFGSGDKYQASQARQWSLNYSPWRIFRLQTSLLSNSKDRYESRVRLSIELPLRLAPEQWWQTVESRQRYDRYQPLQHHKVMVLEHR